MIPNVLVIRKDLSPVEKLIYGYLKHLAWRGGGEEATPTREAIAADLGIGVRTVADALRALTRAPVSEDDEDPGSMKLLVSTRRGLGLPNLYLINDPAGRISPNGGAETDEAERRIPPIPSRAVSLGLREEAKKEILPTVGSLTRPPRIRLTAGRNVPLDTLVRVCGIDEANKARVVQAAAALNGRIAEDGKVLMPGIVHHFWVEATRYAEANDKLDQLRDMYDEPVEFANALAIAIERKALRYERALPPGTLLTPSALAKWWLDVERSRDGGMTPEEMEAYG